jgi:hypothetical protein
VLSLITAENLPQILIAVGGVISAIGGITWWNVRREPPKVGSPDAAVLALVENTRAFTENTKALQTMAANMQAQNVHFGENNDMFKAMGSVVSGVARDISDMRHDTADNKSHLSAIRDTLNRGQK